MHKYYVIENLEETRTIEKVKNINTFSQKIIAIINNCIKLN